MTANAAAAWRHWLDQVRRHLHATPNTLADAEDWAALFGHLSPEAMIELRRAVLVDESCARLGRCHPADAVRILRDRQRAELPTFDEVYADALGQVSAVGWTADADHYDTVAVFAHPLVAAVVTAYGGWLEFCQSESADNRRSQLRRMHAEIVERWTSGPWTVRARSSFRWVLTAGRGWGGATVNGEAEPPAEWMRRAAAEEARISAARAELKLNPPEPRPRFDPADVDVEGLRKLRLLISSPAALSKENI